jgi:hypothetical protein
MNNIISSFQGFSSCLLIPYPYRNTFFNLIYLLFTPEIITIEQVLVTSITEYNEQLVRRLIEKVTIYEDKFTVEFKSGVTVDVNI